MSDLDNLTGNTFLEGIALHEARCAEETARQIPGMGEKAPACHEALGMTLALLDSTASCYWGCKGGDHRLEFLIGRATNSAYSALSLAKRGYYDQSLSIARTIGEIANLLALFAAEPSKLEEWKKADEKTRKRAFSPINVRMAVEALGAPLPMDADRYGRLSTFSIHAIPDAVPQGHNASAQGLTFPLFQTQGFLLALNEIAIATGFITVFVSKLFDFDPDMRKTFQELARVLVDAVGGVQVTVDGRPWLKLH